MLGNEHAQHGNMNMQKKKKRCNMNMHKGICMFFLLFVSYRRPR